MSTNFCKLFLQTQRGMLEKLINLMFQSSILSKLVMGLSEQSTNKIWIISVKSQGESV